MSNPRKLTLKQLHREQLTVVVTDFIKREATLQELQTIIVKCNEQISNLNTMENLGFKREEATYSGTYFLGMDLGKWADFVPH